MKRSIRKGLGFGLNSGVITTLGMMVGLSASTQSRIAVIGGIIAIAIADAFRIVSQNAEINIILDTPPLLAVTDTSLLAYHLPLDAHPELGNNARLAQLLGIECQGSFGHDGGMSL